MSTSVFDPNNQNDNLSSKIVTGLERISEAFKVLLWQKAKQLGLSPIQIQILIFVAYHRGELCNVSHLAKEFNITKPTVSDAIRVMDKKGLVKKEFSSIDSRSYTILLTKAGKDTVLNTEDFANPLTHEFGHLKQVDLENLFETLSKFIFQLNKTGILSVQRTCYGCTYYSKNKNVNYCNLLNKELIIADIRLDCPDYVKSI